MIRFLKQYFLKLLLIFCAACETNNTRRKDVQTDPITDIPKTSIQNSSDRQTDTIDSEYATYFVVVADTNLNYSMLHDKMIKLSKQLNISIDTMGRYFNATKNLIMLPDSDEDEMYAGDYFPRRFPSENLSLEYLNFYQNKASENIIALVTGIYETEKSADSALVILKQIEKSATKIKSDIYMGCMH